MMTEAFTVAVADAAASHISVAVLCGPSRFEPWLSGAANGALADAVEHGHAHQHPRRAVGWSMLLNGVDMAALRARASIQVDQAALAAVDRAVDEGAGIVDIGTLTDAATAFGSTIYKNDDPLHPNAGTAVPACTTPGSGVATASAVAAARLIAAPTSSASCIARIRSRSAAPCQCA